MEGAKKKKPKHWYFVAYDQLNLNFGPWSRGKPGDAGLVLVESLWKPNQRPYHKQKLAFLLTSMRHFAIEAAKHGHPVVYLAGTESYAQALETFSTDNGPLTFMRPAERELRHHLWHRALQSPAVPLWLRDGGVAERQALRWVDALL